jgi:hypothetical protein
MARTIVSTAAFRLRPPSRTSARHMKKLSAQLRCTPWRTTTTAAFPIASSPARARLRKC